MLLPVCWAYYSWGLFAGASYVFTAIAHGELEASSNCCAASISPAHSHPAFQAMTHTRKGTKRSAIYDLKVTMKWEAETEDDEQKVSSLQQSSHSS